MTLRSSWLGTVAYADALAMQTELHRARAADEVPDTLLQLEHPSVYTIGRRGSRAEILWDDDTLRERGVEVHDADRGGRVTYHGPGQLVGYPILRLGPRPDVVRHLRDLEEAILRTLAPYGIAGRRVDGSAGVWVGETKIASIGVRVSRWVTKHGFALNVAPDLSFFGGIVPCGVLGLPVTSIAELNGDAPSVRDVSLEVEVHLADVLGRRLVKQAAA